MKSFLLLVLSLIAGCDARSAVKGCIKAWTEFTCNISNTTGHCRRIIITSPIGMTVINKWERNGRINLIKTLQIEDAGKHTCESYNTTIYDAKLESKYEEDVCLKPFNQTAYRTAKTTITCHDNKSRVRFFYKEKGDICEETRSNGRFTLTATNSSFNMSISNVSSKDAGVYWCGLESKDGNQQTALRQIRLEVKKIPNFTRSPMVGETLTYWCDYSSHTAHTYKFICKGEDPSVCERLVSTQAHKMNNGKFSLIDDRLKRNITITVRDVTADDAGTYWCGAESLKKERSNPFFHRFIMTVGGFEVTGRFEVIITGTVLVAVLLLLLLVLISILIYKLFSHSKKTRPGAAAKHVREDYVYEEIQKSLPKPDTGNAMNSIYVTGNFPTNPSASLHYSTINFQKSSDKAGGEALVPKPCSSACEYSTVKIIQSPTHSTVDQPSTSTEDALYSTVNKPKQQQGKISSVRNI